MDWARVKSRPMDTHIIPTAVVLNSVVESLIYLFAPKSGFTPETVGCKSNSRQFRNYEQETPRGGCKLVYMYCNLQNR